MKNPIVVIVGRPNVGKSTLFNRIVGKRDAIVDNISGVTRDRNYSEADWAGKSFRLIDTGGYVPNSSDLFEIAIREQVQIAIDEADIILFVVDCRDGLNPMDKVIANLLRTSNKKFFLIVNKVDSQNQENLVNDFYSLGVKNIYDVSAAAGRKIGDLLDVITEDVELDGDEEIQDERLRLAIVGRPNVGKSSLTNALLGIDRSIVTNIPGTTRDSIDSILKYYGKEIVLVDTAGLRKKKKVEESIEFFSTIRTLKSIAECDVAIIMVDATIGIEKQDLKIIDEAVRRHKGVIIAVNKWDLVEKGTNTAKESEESIREKMGSADYIPIVFISALTKQRIFKIIELAYIIKEQKLRKIPTNELNDILLPEIQRVPPPATGTGKEVKIKYITQPEGYHPLFLFFTNYPKDIAEHYKRFLEKLIRKYFGFTGAPITIIFKNK